MKPRTSESEEESGKLGEGSSTSQGQRVDAVESRSSSVIVRGSDGSGFVKCPDCGKDVPALLISMHGCSDEAKTKMNLETQLVERPYEAKRPVRKNPRFIVPKAKRAKVEKTKKVKDTDVPKKPPSSFFLFMDDFRESFKEANPDSKDDNRVRKEARDKWRSMTDEEKKPYSDKFAELKVEYEKAMEIYNAAKAGEEGEGEGEHEEGADEQSDKKAAAAGEEGEGEGEHEEGADEQSDKEEAAAGEEEELTDED
ncbi:high mobility group B protein 2-like isoform X3 [Arachis ipaensis]|uniref:high mobility group B protein 2-like isoform X3 n=1 Tax=Arachis ipaensis TaxID=130454 RepID=UPI000A2B4B83|nr:high mobility group B protein 2-like isoform X3 [Arachis ipaensis]XP_025674511.1 high mobility group B protein 2 isoform X2 [Arachis hypogaea]